MTCSNCRRLALHLPPDAVDVLRPAGHCRPGCPACSSSRTQLALDVLDVLLALGALRLEPARDALVFLGLAEAEREVLELPLELPDAEAVRERRIDLLGLERGAAQFGLGRALERAHAHELQRQPDQHQPHVGGEREQQLAQALGLLGLERAGPGSSRPGCRCRRRARVRVASPHGSFAEDRHGPLDVEPPPVQQGHEHAGEQHVVVGLQRGQDGEHVDAAQGVLVGRQERQRSRARRGPVARASGCRFRRASRLWREGRECCGALGKDAIIRRHISRPSAGWLFAQTQPWRTALDARGGRSGNGRRNGSHPRDRSRARRRPGSASSTGGTATPVTWRAARSARAASAFPPRLRQIFDGVLELVRAIPAGRGGDRTRVHASQRRQRAQARAGARGSHLRGVLGRVDAVRICAARGQARHRGPGRRTEGTGAVDGTEPAQAAGRTRTRRGGCDRPGAVPCVLARNAAGGRRHRSRCWRRSP